MIWVPFFLVSIAVSNPIQNVVVLLQSLKNDIEAAGRSELKVHDKFSCWCEDTLNRKGQDIEEMENRVSELSSVILKNSQDSGSGEAKVSHLRKQIKDYNQKLDNLVSAFTKYETSYTEDKESLESDIESIRKALEVLSSLHNTTTADYIPPTTASLAATETQVLSVAGAIKECAARSKILSETSLAKLNDFLANPTHILRKDFSQIQNAAFTQLKVPKKYNFQTTQILGIFKELSKDLQAEYAKKNEEFAAREATFQQNKLSLTERRDTSIKMLKNSEVAQTGSTSDMEANRQERSDTEAVLKETNEFVQQTRNACRDKANEWAERSRFRADEISGLTTAISILTGQTTSAPASKATPLVQGPGETQTGNGNMSVALFVPSNKMFPHISKVASELKTTQGPPKDTDYQRTEEEINAARRFMNGLANLPHGPLRSTSLLQRELKKALVVAQGKPENALQLAQVVYDELAHTAKTTKSIRLASLAAQVKSEASFNKDAFWLITEKFKDLVENLKAEQLDDDKTRDRCMERQRKAGDNEESLTMKKEHLDSAAERFTTKVSQLQSVVQKVNSEIEDQNQILEDLTVSREEDETEFRNQYARNIQNIEALGQAVDSVEAAFVSREIAVSQLQQGASAIQYSGTALEAHKRLQAVVRGRHMLGKQPQYTVSDDTPPDSWTDEYKGSKGGTRNVLTTMAIVKDDLIAENKRLALINQKNQATYLSQKQTGEEANHMNVKKKRDLESKINKVSDQKSGAANTVSAIEAELSSLAADQSQLQTACSWVTTRYGSRKDKRGAEMKSLQEAIGFFESYAAEARRKGYDAEEFEKTYQSEERIQRDGTVGVTGREGTAFL